MLEIAVYGGAFSPPHAGHADVVRQLAGRARRILLVPSYRHAFGKRMAPYERRLAWLRRMAEALAEEGLRATVDACERDLARRLPDQAPIYSWDLLDHLAEREGLPDHALGLVVGEDNRNALPRFHRAEELLARFPLLVAREQVALHSAQIRSAIEAGQPIAPEWLPPGLVASDYECLAGTGRPIRLGTAV